MLTVTSTDEKSSCFKFIGADSTPKTTHLISNNTSLLAPSGEGCTDTCSFYSGPSDSTIMAFGETCGSIAYAGGGETCGSIAYSGGGETCGSIAYSGGGETCGSIASASVSSGGGFSGGGCSYSC